MAETANTLRFDSKLLESGINDDSFIVLMQAMVGLFDNCRALSEVLNFVSQKYLIKNKYMKVIFALEKQDRISYLEDKLQQLFGYSQNFRLKTETQHEILEELADKLVSPPDDYFRPYHNPALWKKRMAQLYDVLISLFNGSNEIKLISPSIEYQQSSLNTIVHPEIISYIKQLFTKLLPMINFDADERNSFSTIKIHYLDKVYTVCKGAGQIRYDEVGWHDKYYGKICYRWDGKKFIFNYWC